MNNFWTNQDMSSYFDSNTFFNEERQSEGYPTLQSKENYFTTLHFGDNNGHVRELQTHLRRLGYYTGTIDGVFGSTTRQAVERFQRERGLRVDGVVGTQTWNALTNQGGSLTSNVATQSSSVINPNSTSTMYLGSKGGQVRELQTHLKRLGYYTGVVDGIFGSNTKQAVERFQREHQQKVDGIVGHKTWLALNQVMPSATKATNTKKKYVTNHGVPTIQVGSSNNYVRELQKRLNALGYYTGPIDSKFGSRTKQAVERFQRAHSLTVDGVVGPSTWEMINRAYANAGTTSNPTMHSNTTTNTEMATMHIGQSNDSIRELQTRLKRLGYYSGAVDGKFGSATKRAVETFQRKHGLPVDGVVASSTWAALEQALSLNTNNGFGTPEILPSPTKPTLNTVPPISIPPLENNGNLGTPNVMPTPTPLPFVDNNGSLGGLNTTLPPTTPTPMPSINNNGSLGIPNVMPTPTPIPMPMPSVEGNGDLGIVNNPGTVPMTEEGTTNIPSSNEETNNTTWDSLDFNPIKINMSATLFGEFDKEETTEVPKNIETQQYHPNPMYSMPINNAMPTLQIGMCNNYVRDLQMSLCRLGYYMGPISGQFDRRTKQAVERFQCDHGLIVNGVVCPVMWDAINFACASMNNNLGY